MAHISGIGTAGNIPALTINQICCKADNSVFVKNDSPFTGGTDPQDYTYITEQDANAVVEDFEAQTTQEAQNKLRGEMQGGETMTTNPQCKTKRNSTQPIGDTGKNVPSAAISITVTCSTWVYNQSELHTLLTPKLQQQARSDLGSAYTLRGSLTTRVMQQRQADNHITLTIEASGTWVYTWDTAARQALARHIAGQTVAQARDWLRAQPGVATLTIDTPGDRLPTNPNQITFIIKT
jgi:VCBS repeat-containing protein